jgi:hypothetical protein
VDVCELFGGVVGNMVAQINGVECNTLVSGKLVRLHVLERRSWVVLLTLRYSVSKSVDHSLTLLRLIALCSFLELRNHWRT